MAKKLILTNKSRECRVVMASKKDKLEPRRLPAGSSIPIAKSEVSPQMEEMLRHPRTYGLHLEEEVTASGGKSSKKKGDEEDE